jgi:hypothetical protein
MKRTSMLLAVAIAIAVVSGCGNPPLVFQGKVESTDQAAATVVVRDGETTLTFSLAGAAIGAQPDVGDEIRLAYFDEGGTLRATRVMNLTKQAELGKKGGGGH